MTVRTETRVEETARIGRTRRARRSAVLEIVGASAAGIGVGMLAYDGFGASGLTSVLLGYLAFVGVVALVEYARAPVETDVIDLTVAPSDDIEEPEPAPLLVAVPDVPEGQSDVPRSRRRITGADLAEL